MTERDRDSLVEQVASAWRPRSLDGDVQAHPAWHDLDVAGRDEAYEVSLALRTLESALDPQGLSTTGHAVLARIRGAGSR